MLARSPLFEKFSLQRNFQGLLSIVQLSRFLSFFPCDSFDILSNLFRFVKNFFIFLFLLPPSTGQLRYSTIFSCHLSTVFYKFFQVFYLIFISHYIWYFYMILSHYSFRFFLKIFLDPHDAS